MQRMAEVKAYNAAHADAEFDGVVLDVEPPEPQSTADFQNLLALYQCVRNTLPQGGSDRLGLAVAIRFFWAAVVYEHIIDMELDHVIVMGYRDRAGTVCSGAAPNGIICLDEGQMAYADRAAENDITVESWKTLRFRPSFPGFEVDVVDARGNSVQGNTKLDTVRATYLTRKK